MKTGIELIAEERQKQITKHGFTGEHHAKHPEWYADNQLVEAATVLSIPDLSRNVWFPKNWDSTWFYRLCRKPYEDRLQISAALLAAEIDRLQFQRKEVDAPFQPFADAIKDAENPKDTFTVEGKVFKEGDRVYGTWVSNNGYTHYKRGVIIRYERTGLWVDDEGTLDNITEIKRFIFLNKDVEPVKPPYDPNWPKPFA